MSRKLTGKTSRGTIIGRMLAVYSTPAIFLSILLAASGWIVAVVPLLVGWFGVVIGKHLIEWFATNAISDRSYQSREYRDWRNGGGDVYFDQMGWPFNNDAWATKLAAPPTHHDKPPDHCCVRCGGAWNGWQGMQCMACYTYWDVPTQQYMYVDPDPALIPYVEAADDFDTDDPSIYTPTRNP